VIYAYAHRSRAADGRVSSGVLYASSAAEAHFRLRHRLAREPMDIRFDPWHTLSQWLQPEFRVRDLVSFYRAFGRRLERGQAIQPGLEQAQEFVTDPRLIQAVALLAHGLKEGQRLGNALRAAGFPERDAAALDAVADTGRLPETLQVLASELERRARLAQALRRTLQMPLTIALLLHCGLYLALVLFLPTMARFYAALGATALPPMAEALFACAAAFRANLLIATLGWLGVPVLCRLALTSAPVARLWERIPVVEQLLERSELASLWSGFATLYDAGVQVEEACRLLQAAATRPAARRWFAALGRELHAGWPLVQAVSRAGFPRYVARAVHAADSGGDLVAGLRALAEGLAEDVTELGARQEHWVRVAASLIAAALIAGFFLVTYYPMLASTFSQL
jgi:type II secretory pathway component PulF